MKRLVALGIVIAVTSLRLASTQKSGTVIAEDGQVGIGAITGGQFGPGSFSIGVPGSSHSAQRPDNGNINNGNGGPIISPSPTNDGGQQIDNLPSQHENNGGNWQVTPEQPQRQPANQGHGGKGGQGSNEEKFNTVVAENGSVAIGVVTGKQFGAGSFSIGVTSSNHSVQRPDNSNVYVGDGNPTIYRRPTNNDRQQMNNRSTQHGNNDKPNSEGGNWQVTSEQPQRLPAYQGYGGKGGYGGGDIVISTVIMPNRKNNKRRKPGKEKFATVIAENGQVGIGAITGGQFGPGSFSIRAPGSIHPVQRPDNSNIDIGNGGPILSQRPTNNNGQQMNNRSSEHGNYEKFSTVVAADGPVGIGAITGGQFDAGSFSVGATGSTRPAQRPNNSNVYEGNSGPIISNRPTNNDVKQMNNRPSQRGSYGKPNSGGSNWQVTSEQPQRLPANQGHGGQGSYDGGDIGTVVIPKRRKIKRIKPRNGHTRQPSSSGSSGFPGGSIHIGSITGGSFAPTSFTNYNKRPIGANKSQKEGALMNGYTGNPNADNQAYTIGPGGNSNGGTNVGNDQVKGQIKLVTS